jgi:hypothetical protein
MRRLFPLALLILGLACGGSSKHAATPAPAAAPYIATVTALVNTPNADQADPVDLATLDLQGLDENADPAALDPILGN